MVVSVTQIAILEDVEFQELWVCAQRGDGAALERLLELIGTLARRYAAKLGVQVADRSDVSQEVVWSILSHLGSLDCPRNYKQFIWWRTWSRTTTHRRQSARFECESRTTWDDVADSTCVPHWQTLSKEEHIAELRDCMTRLPSKWARAMKLRWVEGASVKATAQRLEVSTVTVRNWLHSGYDAVLKCMQQKGVDL